MIELRFLGGAVLQQGEKLLTGPAARRHPVALLALLATAPSRTLSRTKVIGLLWPDADEPTGRNRLTSILHLLRRALGPSSVASVGNALQLDDRAVSCDVWDFQRQLEAGDRAAAARVYRGPFLDGFYLEGSSLFNERLDGERQVLHRSWWEAVQKLAEGADTAGRPRDAAHWWQALAAADPLDSGVAARLLRALAMSGSHREALRAAEVHAAWLREELGVAPDAEFARLVEQVRSAPVIQHPVPAVAAQDVRPAVAVLPFETLGSAEMALGEGVHSGILTRLSTLDGLSVISRTSVRRYRDSDKRPAEIAAELGVRWVLEGDVQASGGHFRVNVRLIEAPSDRNAWAQSHEGRLTAENFFQVQADIAGEIADQVSLQLTPEERRRLQEKSTASLEAYRLCIEGRMHLDGRSPESMQRALRCFEKALAVDPDYAVAWVGVGDALGLLHAYGYAGEDVLPRAGQAIEKALECDPRCAEAHAALGRLLGQRNVARESLDELQHAIALAPGYAEAHNWLSVGLYVTGDAAGALASASRAVALNPLSAEAVSNLGSCYLFTGRLEQALKETRRARELGGDYASAAFYEAIALYELERYAETAALLEALVVPWVGSGVNTVRALALAAQGNDAAARELLEPIHSAGHGFDEGLVLAALGEREAALDALAAARLGGLDMAVSYWPSVAVHYLFGRIWASLRDDPRYAQLRHHVDEIYGPATLQGTT